MTVLFSDFFVCYTEIHREITEFRKDFLQYCAYKLCVSLRKIFMNLCVITNKKEAVLPQPLSNN